MVLVDEATNRPIRLSELHKLFIQILCKYDSVVIFSFIESGKSQLISVGYTLWCLGRDSSLRVAILSRSTGQAVKLGRSLGRYIEQSSELHEVFPKLVPGTPWNETERSVVRASSAKDASIQLFGVDGPVTGSRVDLLLLDDCADLQNSGTVAQRQRLSRQFFAEFWGRRTARAKFVSVATPYDRNDLNHELINNGVQGFTFGVIDDHPESPNFGKPRWAERWPLSRILKTRRGMPAREAARQLDCRLTANEAAVFHDQWILHAIERGAQVFGGQSIMMTRTPQGWGLVNRPRGVRIVVGVDPASSMKPTADLCALAAVARHPDGSFEVLTIESGRWGTPAAISRIINLAARFAPDGVVVEGNGMQTGWAQLLGLAGVNVIEHVTTRATREARLGELEVALANGKWLLPSVDGRIRDAETAVFAQQLLDFARGDHVPDRVVAVMLAAWALEQTTSQRMESFSLDLQSR